MKALLLLLVPPLCGCATAIVERPNPSGGTPLTAFVTSSDAEEIQFTSASGAAITMRRLDNSSGPREAIRLWGTLDLWRKITGVAGDLGRDAIDTAAGEQ